MEIRSGVALSLWRFVLPPFFCALPALSAGAADTAREERQVSGFHSVVVRTAGDLQIIQGDRESLSVEAEAAVLPKLGTTVRDGVLYIESKASPIITQQPIRFGLALRELRAFRTYGSGSVSLTGISGEALSIDVAGSSNISGTRMELSALRLSLSGSGTVTLEGKARRQDIRISGAGQYSAAQLLGEEASIVLSGAGNASVNVTRSLDVEISGSGDVRYSGDPVLKQKVVGAGSVKRASE